MLILTRTLGEGLLPLQTTLTSNISIYPDVEDLRNYVVPILAVRFLWCLCMQSPAYVF